MTKQELLAQLAPYGQEHVLRFWDELSPEDRTVLAAQIAGLDLAQIEELYRGERKAEDWASLARRAQPPPAFRLDGPGNRFSPSQARARGEEALRASRVGAILVAGGQGTRLGFDHPKGMFPVGPVSRASLFQVLFEKLLAVGRRYATRVPLYLMTSPATHEETVDYLARHERFGLPEDDLRIFCQGTMPAVDAATGRLLLAEKGRLSLSPDGHGGMLAALTKSGSLEDIRHRGLQQIYYFQVDNPLAGVCDPEFVGYHLLAGSEMSTQVVAKRAPRDNVGNMVLVDGRMRILEYSDLNPLPDEIVLRKTADGTQVFWAGNTGMHVFDVAFLERMAASQQALPFHVAKKKVAHLDEQGRRVEPAEPNAIKFEKFIFDLLPEARQAIVVEVEESRAFAPVKNAPGAERDSPEMVEARMVSLHREWLEQARAWVKPGVKVEISPLVALDAQELASKIEPGIEIDKDTYLRESPGAAR